MKKNLLSLLVLTLLMGLAVSACTKKEEPTEVSNLIDDSAMPMESDAMSTDLDEDIFDLDTATDSIQETAVDAADTIQDTAADAIDDINETATDATNQVQETASEASAAEAADESAPSTTETAPETTTTTTTTTTETSSSEAAPTTVAQ